MNPPTYNEAVQQPSPSPSAPPPTAVFIDYPPGAKALNPGPTTQFLGGSSQQQEPPPQEEIKFGWTPQRAYCPNCRQYVRTDIEAGVNDQCKFITAITCCLGALACGMCCLGVFPIMCLTTKNHICPICHLKIGEHVPRAY